jgi:hypothetical protein
VVGLSSYCKNLVDRFGKSVTEKLPGALTDPGKPY